MEEPLHILVRLNNLDPTTFTPRPEHADRQPSAAVLARIRAKAREVRPL